MGHHQWEHSSHLGLDLSQLRLRGLELLSHKQVEVEEDTHIPIQTILLLGSGNLCQVRNDLIWIDLWIQIYR